jgi:hypothetical protein
MTDTTAIEVHNEMGADLAAALDQWRGHGAEPSHELAARIIGQVMQRASPRMRREFKFRASDELADLIGNVAAAQGVTASDYVRRAIVRQIAIDAKTAGYPIPVGDVARMAGGA